MTRCVLWLVVGLLFLVGGASAYAQVVPNPVATPVDHPLVAAAPVRISAAWRKGVEGFGENLAVKSLTLRGYIVQNVKLPGNHGIDLYAIKRNSAGSITDIRLVEVKTHYGQSRPRLGQTQAGPQMSRKWLADRLRALRSSGEEGKKLALDISRFRKAEGIPLESLGEVHDINLQTGKYTIRNPITMAERAGPMSIERLLKKIASHSSEPASEAWAMRHLSELGQIQESRMGHWLTASSSVRALDRVSVSRLVLLEEKLALRGLRRGLVRVAGPVGLAVAIAMDAYEIYGHVRDYRLGKLSQREFVIAIARSGGGIAGASSGAVAGAWVGGGIGAYGGPWAWVTVPVGGIIGGAIGGFMGYFAGSTVGQFTAQAWYGSIDNNVRDQVNRWFKELHAPTSN